MDSLTQEQRALFVAGGQLDDYDVLKPIGKGKFSVVYKAKRKCDGQPIALKKIAIFDMMDAKAREKTLKEVRDGIQRMPSSRWLLRDDVVDHIAPSTCI